MKRSSDENTPDTKRQKTSASKVLHVRSLPSTTTEAELANLLAPYGQIVKTFLMLEKGQAFVQMTDVETAERTVEALEQSPASIAGRTVYFQFSARQEIEAKAYQEVGDSASCVIIVTVTNVAVPVTLDNIHQVCKPYGDILKIITFNKKQDFQALVQFATSEQAEQARRFLDRKDLFQGCCHLRLAFSSRQHLVVKQNDFKSRDFTLGGVSNSGLMEGGGQYGGGQGQFGGGGQYGGGQGQYGGGDRGFGGGQGQSGYPQNAGFAQQGGFPSNSGYPQQGGFPPSQAQGGPQAGSPVVLVNKLDETRVTPDMLYTLFGVYGDVLRVKILYNKRDSAMIQFGNSQQAAFARQHLHGVPLFDQQLVVLESRHQEVKLPRVDPEASEASPLTQDYTSSSDHRFKGRTANPNNVHSPSQVLHVANIHKDCTVEDLQSVFGQHQPNSPQSPVVEFFKSSRAMAYICMDSLDSAVMALINVHNTKLNGYSLRVNFSKKEPGQVKTQD